MLQEFVQNVEDVARDAVNGIHTAMPGVITSFDPGNCTASVQPQGKYTAPNGEKLAYPCISAVPVVFPCGGPAGAGIAFPVKAGDSCIVVIAENELDEWRSGAEAEGSLRFDLSNAMAIPGLSGAGDLVQKAVEKDAVVFGLPDARMVTTISKDGVDAEIGETVCFTAAEDGVTGNINGTEFQISEDGAEFNGDLAIRGKKSVNFQVSGIGLSISEDTVTVNTGQTELTVSRDRILALSGSTRLEMAENEMRMDSGTVKFSAVTDMARISVGEVLLNLSTSGITAGVGDVQLTLSESGTVISGNVTVDGDISYTGSLKSA